ncbi:MAG: hypothetical protein GQ573_05580 [Gammaproteobacteria bacterium]|nr:hypothetical protein [Gammaproteobacteria bacterium]
MIKVIQFVGMLFLFCSPVMAGTIIEIQNNNELTTLITDGQKVRMNMSESEYAILDYSNHSAQIINPQKKQVMFLNVGDMTAGNNVVTVQISINKLGDGQEIAGYKTQKFSYKANGRSCGVIYGSKNAYQTDGIKELVAALKTLMEKQRVALGGFASLVDICTLADMQLMDHINTVGLPLRTEKNGRAELEIKMIKAGVSLADDTFVIPASYRMLGEKQQMKAVATAVPTAISTAISTERVRPQQQRQQTQMRQPRQLPPQAMNVVPTAIPTAIPTEMAKLQQQPQMRQYRRPPPQAWQQRRPGPEMMRRYQYPGY